MPRLRLEVCSQVKHAESSRLRTPEDRLRHAVLITLEVILPQEIIPAERFLQTQVKQDLDITIQGF